MRHLAFATMLLLAGCAQWQVSGAPPVSASLGGERLAVTFSDGEVCHADVPLTGGAGTFADCPDRGGWQVTISKRNLLEPIFGAVVSPYGRIAVTGPTGRTWVFITPPPHAKRR